MCFNPNTLYNFTFGNPYWSKPDLNLLTVSLASIKLRLRMGEYCGLRTIFFRHSLWSRRRAFLLGRELKQKNLKKKDKEDVSG